MKLRRGDRSQWRGSPVSAGHEGGLPGSEEATPSRVAVLIRHEGNRAHVLRQLAGQCEVLHPDGARLAPGSFDLAITDVAGLRDWWTLLLDAKFHDEPTFLPVVLILSRPELKRHTKAFWDVVDEFVTSPVEPREFIERISMLLRTRHLALTQRNHLAYVVNHDRVTGLPNQVPFMARLRDAVRDASVLGERAHVTVVRLPLARILKSLGHQGMNTIAAKAASRLVALGEDDVSVARLTTEDWGLVHRAGAPLSEVLDVLGRVRSLADTSFEVDEENVHLAPRMGVGVYPLDASDAASVLDRAMAALATATDSEPVFYSREVQEVALRSIRTESRLHDALEEGHFELHFQPQIDLGCGEVSGVEALVRWRLPSGDLVPPGQFIRVAEETGLIREIDAWVLTTACRTMREWLDEGIDVRHVSVNVCAQDVAEDAFVPSVRAALEAACLPPSRLELELTETDLIGAGSADDEKLRTLEAEGVRIAVDDFGTGYSSLAYLRSLPATTLKIDRSFITDITSNEKHQAITEAMAWLGRRFGLETVAEGIETTEEADHLSGLGVPYAQGFLYARPMPEADFRAWFHKRGVRHGLRSRNGARRNGAAR